MATHSSILAWRIPGTGEPGGLQSMGSHRVGHTKAMQQQQQHVLERSTILTFIPMALLKTESFFSFYFKRSYLVS